MFPIFVTFDIIGNSIVCKFLQLHIKFVLMFVISVNPDKFIFFKLSQLFKKLFPIFVTFINPDKSIVCKLLQLF